MKKSIMIGFLTLAVAFMAQATQISWNCSGITDSTGAKLPKGTFAAYLFNVSDLSTAAAFDAAKEGKLDIGLSLNMSTGMNDGVAGTIGAEVDKGYTTGVPETMYAVVFDSLDPTSGNFFVTTTKSVNIKGVGATMFGLGKQTPTWTPVNNIPEPTTAALLALGLAAFGLKRKVAK